MAQESENNNSGARVRGVLSLVLVVAALGIAAVLWLSNAPQGTAGECEVDPRVIDGLDEMIVGQMAAVQVDATGRGYADLPFVDGQGNETTLAAFLGKPVLVNFWATWCGPCREEMPALNTLAARYDRADFEVLTIDLDMGEEGIEKARQFLAEHDLENLPLLADPTFAAFDRLKSSGVSLGLPTTLLLDERGCELAVLQGPAEWAGEDAFALIDRLIELVGAPRS